MTVSELIQQQRHILRALLNAVRQYQQEIAQAQERLERTLEQIQADKAAAEQEAKREYEQARDKYITTILDAELPMSGVKDEKLRASREQARANLRTQLLSAASKKRGALSGIYDTNTIVEHIRKINPQMAVSRAKTNVKMGPVAVLSLVFSVIGLLTGTSCVLSSLASFRSSFQGFLFYLVMGFVILGVSLVVQIPARRYYKRLSEAAKKAHQDELAYLSALYDHWLELITNQTQSRNAEARQAHQRALEQAKQRFANSLQQLRPTLLNYTTLADQTSPPWQSEAWQDWKPGTLTPGVVRLGVFTLQPDQLEAKPVKIGEIVGIANAKLVSNSGGTR
jgi:hypothetical protein